MVEQNTPRRRGTGLIVSDPAAASPGYTLFAPLTGTGQAYLVGLDGTVVHQWDLPYRPGRHARLLSNGSLAYNGTLPDALVLFPMWLKYHGGALCEAGPSGAIVREYRDELHHHDAYHYGDGRILYTAVEPLTGAAARAVPGGVAGSESERPRPAGPKWHPLRGRDQGGRRGRHRDLVLAGGRAPRPRAVSAAAALPARALAAD